MYVNVNVSDFIKPIYHVHLVLSYPNFILLLYENNHENVKEKLIRK